MSKLEFKPEDFQLSEEDSPIDAAMISFRMKEQCADQANKRLAEMLKDATVVCGSIVKHKDEYEWSQDFKQGDTHKALLIEVEPIIKLCKSHEADSTDSDTSRCIHCGIELVQKWVFVPQWKEKK